MRILFLVLMLFSTGAWAEPENDLWAFFYRVAHEPEFLAEVGVTQQTTEQMIEYVASAQDKMAQAEQESVRSLCSQRDFYAGAPEHLADKIDAESAKLNALRKQLARDFFGAFTVLDHKRVKDYIFANIKAWREEETVKPGDSVRFGQKDSRAFIKTMCGGVP